METFYMKIDGMFCAHCRETVAKGLMQEPSIETVKVRGDVACICCRGTPDYEAWIARVRDLGYAAKREAISRDGAAWQGMRLGEFAAILAALLLLMWGSYRIFGYNIFNVIPTIDSSVTYGALVVTGLLTSIHCISMCGAINLTAVFQEKGPNPLLPVLYNGGRLLSYTAIGCAVGGVGSLLQINDTVSGAVLLLAAALMLLMALHMLGFVPLPSLPCRALALGGRRNAFVIGLLNGLMPCGPLQAMQLYALSTGSVWLGGLSLFLFGLGTVPLMLSMGLLVHVLRGSWRVWINKVASVLILLLSLVLLNRALLSLGVDLTKRTLPAEDMDRFITATLQGDYQVVESALAYDGYGDILVQKDLPVQFHIYVEEQYLTGCNETVVLQDFGIKQKLEAGDNVIEFTPTETGDYTYTCWMRMLSNTIRVVDDETYFEGG